MLVAWATTHTRIDLVVLAIILLMATVSTLLVLASMRYLSSSWEYVTDPLYITLLFGQLLDASATSYGIDFHPGVTISNSMWSARP